MSDIINQLFSQIGPQGIQKISSQIGTDNRPSTNAPTGVNPTLFNAWSSNYKSKDGTNSPLVELGRNRTSQEHDLSFKIELKSSQISGLIEDSTIKHGFSEKRINKNCCNHLGIAQTNRI
jgi:hypothetical protein